MTNRYYIAPPDLHSGKQMNELVRPICASALCLFPGTGPSPEEYRKAVLVLTDNDPEKLPALLKNPSLPESTPILVLVTGETIPPPVIKPAASRLIDYLVVPVSQEIFRHRISFLCQVQKISTEHHANSATLDKQLSALSTRDPLTGLFNRRHLTTTLMELLRTAEQNDTELSLLIFNIDFFNKVNKSAGLHFGDFILNELAARLTIATRDVDTCYRFSGEDFVVLMPGADLEQATRMAEKIDKACSGKPYVFGRKKQQITISAGIASLREHRPISHDDFITMAETALFLAKAYGRNRIHVYSPQNGADGLSPKKSLTFLKETLTRILEQTRNSAIASLQLLAQNVAGPEHQVHISTVSHYVTLLGNQLGLAEQHIQTFQNAITLYSSFRSLLHNDLHTKPGKLSREERKTMGDLPFKLTELTDMFDYFANERNLLLCHGERYDGMGYPQGLKGEEIPLGARIFCIVDAVAAMNADRPYRRKLTPVEIVEELKKEAGRQFDPSLVAQLFTVIEKNHLLDLDPHVLYQARQEVISSLPDEQP
jgi:diguanylate cyclase (GGDEF)-like protein